MATKPWKLGSVQDCEETALVGNMRTSKSSQGNQSSIRTFITGSKGDQYGTNDNLESSISLQSLKESGNRYKRKKRLEQVAVIVAAVFISTIIAVGGVLIAIHPSNKNKEHHDKATEINDTVSGNTNYAEYFPNLEYAVFGYNILNAYPMAFGHDPGFTHPIFLVSYSKKKQNADLTYHIPDGLDVVRDEACDTSFSSTVIQSQEEFDKSLSVSAGASGGGCGVKFSASAQYKKDSAFMSSEENIMLLTSAKCQQFFTQVNEFQPPPFHPSFIGWAKKLNNTRDDRDYLDFIQYYGTHVLSEVAYGAKYMYQFVMNSTSYRSMKGQGISVETAISLHFKFSFDAKFSVSDSQMELYSKFKKDVKTRTISLGTPPPLDHNVTKWANQAFTNPVPISYNLLPIDQLFTDKFMNGLDIDNSQIRHKLLHVMNVQYRKEVFDRSSNLECRMVNHAIKLPESACFQKSFQLMGRQSGSQCHGHCLETQDCLGITYDAGSGEVNNDCHTMYRMSYVEHAGLLANQMNGTGQRRCNTYVFPYRQTSNYGLNQPSWLMIKGVTMKISNKDHLPKIDLDRCKGKCTILNECVAITSYMKDSDWRCGLFTKKDVNMAVLETYDPASAVGFIKQCS